MPLIDQVPPQRCNVLGVGISAIDMQEALGRTDRLLQQRGKGYICVTGVHGIMEAQRDPRLRQTLNRSFLCTPDGMPAVWVGRLQGHRHMRRVYGPDFMLEMCRLSVDRRYRHFLYGGNIGVAEKLKSRLEQMVPGLNIVGTFTPPFGPLSPVQEAAFTARVADARPDIIWVGLSTPRQERFMAQMLDRVDTCVMVGVGAAFDIHAGLVTDAPQWMKSCGLQWFHRLIKEPRRLWRRYLLNNPRFLWGISLQLARLRKFSLEQP